LTNKQINIPNQRDSFNTEYAIIIFVRHPQLGKVKTRLAATLGDKKALAIYKLLLAHTYSLIQNGKLPVYVYYADAVVQDDLWQGGFISKKQQQGADLGERMHHAFAEVFAAGHQKVVIIGSDCYELTEAIITEAFTALEKSDAVIGPASDGGYYLLGLKKMIPAVFENIAWSTATVKDDTVQVLIQNNIAFSLLPTLRDVDEEKDLPDTIKQQL
jgi:uncharacterized protein